MDLVAIHHTCRQYSEDSWEPVHKVKKITPETTVREIVEWAANGWKFEKIITFSGPITIEEIKL